MCRLSALPQAAAPHDAQFLLELRPCVHPLQPHFHVFLPNRHKAPQFWRAGMVAKAQWRETALKNHFMKHPCSRRPSHKARAADFPFTSHPPTHAPKRRGSGTAGPCSHPLGAPGSRNSRGWHRRTLGSKPCFWHLPRGPGFLWSAEPA